MSLKNYEADQISIVFGAIIIDSGFADGTFVTIEQNEASYTTQVGTDGEVTRSKTNNRTATITFALMQSSDANDLLSAAHLADINSSGGTSVFPVLIRDKNGTSLYAGSEAWIEKPPRAEYGREATSREWTIAVSELVAHYGSN